MARIGYGYGSEWHLLRWMGRYRNDLIKKIREVTNKPNSKIDFLDFHFNPSEKWPDSELKGIEFLLMDHSANRAWEIFWPQSGNIPNWDAVGKITDILGEEWLLVEAKAHSEELISNCGGKEHGGLPIIRKAFQTTINQLGITANVSSWLKPYYQYANHLSFLSFLHSQDIPSHLLNIYF